MMKKLCILFLVMVISLAGCVSQPSPEPTAPPTIPATVTPTLEPTPTTTPTTTPTPEATATPEPICEFSNEFLRNLKELVDYEEFTLYFNIIQGIRTLAIWYVDPLIDPEVDSLYLERNLEEAAFRAYELAIDVRSSDPCVDVLVEKINTIGVDRNYFGWFSVQVSPTDLPPSKDKIQISNDEILSSFEIGYLLEEIPPSLPPAPEGSCIWPETKEAIFLHFAPERENVSFEYTIDRGGINLWAQWDGPAESVFVLVNLMNILMEVDCLYPAPTRMIVIVVSEETAELSLLGVIDAEDGVLKPENLQVVIQ